VAERLKAGGLEKPLDSKGRRFDNASLRHTFTGPGLGLDKKRHIPCEKAGIPRRLHAPNAKFIAQRRREWQRSRGPDDEAGCGEGECPQAGGRFVSRGLHYCNGAAALGVKQGVIASSSGGRGKELKVAGSGREHRRGDRCKHVDACGR